jgi:hypothetical protein
MAEDEQIDEEEIEELDDPEFMDDDSNETPPLDIVAFNELRSCADLARMHSQGVLQINPDFQRDFVWKVSDQTRFIDSLIKQLPIPSMCFALDYKTDRWIVIDGLQRISSIIKFLAGGDWRLSRLKDIDPKIAGIHVASIKETSGELRRYYDRVQNKTLPITILRCDFSKKNHMEYLFTIFHRLNSGGSKLNNQEIRNCIYGGPLNELLRELDKNRNWRKINRMKSEENYRFVKQELILRFFAFLDRPQDYKGQVAKFLNTYMHDNRHAGENFLDEKRELFDRVTKVLGQKLFTSAPKDRIPTSVAEALLVAVAKNLEAADRPPLSGPGAMLVQEMF